MIFWVRLVGVKWLNEDTKKRNSRFYQCSILSEVCISIKCIAKFKESTFMIILLLNEILLYIIIDIYY